MPNSQLNASYDVLLLVNDATIHKAIAARISALGFRVNEAFDLGEAERLAESRSYDVVLVEVREPVSAPMISFLERIRATGDGELIVLSPNEQATELPATLKALSADLLVFSRDLKQFESVVLRACEKSCLRRENAHMKAILQRERATAQFIGASAETRELQRLVERAAQSEKPVLIQGEAGTGKKLVARAIHEQSRLSDKPFVIANCSLPDDQCEVELFGCDRPATPTPTNGNGLLGNGSTGNGSTGNGAATSAHNGIAGAMKSAGTTPVNCPQGRPGLLEVAEGSTLFFHEIDKLSPAMQAKLVKALERGTVRRVGGAKERRLNIRIIASSRRNLALEVDAGRFRRDLLDRIDILRFSLPALRNRREDIPALVQHCLGTEWKIQPDALNYLVQHEWTGNICELFQTLERAKILADDGQIRLEHVSPSSADVSTKGNVAKETSSSVDLESIKRQHVLQVYQRERGNKVRTARALGVSRRSLYRLLEKYRFMASQDQAISN